MINLLPQDVLLKNKKERINQVIIVALFMCFITILIAVCMLLPSYFISATNEMELSATLDTILSSKDHEEAQGLPVELARATLNLGLLEQNKNKTSFFDVLNKIVRDRPSDISFESFIISNRSKNDDSRTITISGISETRDELIAFVKQLKNNESFTSVDLPISNLAHETEVEFKISISGNL